MVGMLLEAKPYLNLLAEYVIPAGASEDTEDGEGAAPDAGMKKPAAISAA